VIAVVCAILAILCYALAMFGVSFETFDLATLGHVFVAATLLVMNLPPVRWTRG
jgi:hypothetical protein